MVSARIIWRQSQELRRSKPVNRECTFSLESISRGLLSSHLHSLNHHHSSNRRKSIPEPMEFRQIIDDYYVCLLSWRRRSNHHHIYVHPMARSSPQSTQLWLVKRHATRRDLCNFSWFFFSLFLLLFIIIYVYIPTKGIPQLDHLFSHRLIGKSKIFFLLPFTINIKSR